MEYDDHQPQGQEDGAESSAVTTCQQQQHPFGQEERVSAEQLFVSFCNNLYLGQWELARACALRLAEIEDFESRQPQNIVEVLKAVVRHPYNCVGSESIPSPHDLSWMTLQLHDGLQAGNKKVEQFSAEEKQQTDFRLLLYVATLDRNVPEDTIQEICNNFSQIHKPQLSRSSPSTLSSKTPQWPPLSQQTKTFLKSLLKDNAMLGHSILQHLKDTRQGVVPNRAHNISLQQLYIDCIFDALADLRSSDSSNDVKANAVQHIFSMLSLFDAVAIMVQLPLENLFTNLISFHKAHPDILAIHSIYATLMGRKSTFLISEFCRVEDKMRLAELNSLVGSHSAKLNMMSQDVRVTLRLSEMKDREEVWKEIFFQAINGGKHTLENMVETSLTFIREGMFDALQTLMTPEEFHPLKPLILFLGWSYVNSCAKANKLLEALFASEEQCSKDPLLEQACNKLAYQVHLVQWCLEKARPLMLASGLDPAIDPKASELFHGLDSHSVLRVLHQSTHLSQLEPSEVFDMLSKRPQLEMKQAGDESKEGEKCVRFASSVDEPAQLTIQQERDITIYRSFLAIKLFMDALEYSVCYDNGWPYRPLMQKKGTTETTSSDQNSDSTSSSDEETTSEWDRFVTQKLNKAREYLSELYPLNYRVEVLEDIFSLLFVRHEHLTTEGTNATSDSGGEEGLVDDDWQNKSITSLESIEIPEPSQLGMMSSQGHAAKEVTFHQSTSSERGQKLKQSDVVGDKISTEKAAGVPVSGILKQRVSGMHGNGSSEASQYSNGSLNLQGKVGFVASETFTHDFIRILKECMLDLTSTKFALSGSATGKSDAHCDGKSSQSEREMTKYLKCTVKSSTLAQRISKLSQHINEAWWRFQLVSEKSKQSRSGTIHESSSDEDLRSLVRDSDAEDGDDGRKKRKKKKKRNEGRSRSASDKFSVVVSASPTSDMFSTEGTSSGTEKRRKRKRSRTRPDEKLVWNDNSIIARMLSTKETLLRMCLRRGSYTQAQQVIKMFEMEGKSEVSEVYFAEFWENAARKIRTADSKVKSKSSPPLPGKLASGKPSIASMAAAGVASLSVTSAVDELLTTSSLPTLPEALQVVASEMKSPTQSDVLQHLDGKRVPSMVVFDLSITSCKSWQSCKDLLDVAKGRLDVRSGPPESVSRQRSQTGASNKTDQPQALLGVVPLIHQMYNLVNLSKSDCNIRQDVLKAGYEYSIKDALLNASNSLDVTNLCMQINNTLDLKKAISSLNRALKTGQTGFMFLAESSHRTLSPEPSPSERLKAEISPTSSPTKSRATSLVHQSTKHLLQVFDKVTSSWYTVYALPQDRGKKKEHEEVANYLLSLYNHVSVLASLLLEAKDWHPGLNRPVHSGSMKAPNPFSILDESPSLLLGRLMFQNQIPPIRLEGVANQLKLNLVHIIVQSCCPCIPVQAMLPSTPTLPAISATRPAKPTAATTQSSLKILNGNKDWTQPARNPELVARELLNRMITLMKSHIDNYTSSKQTCDQTGIVLAVSSSEYQDIVKATAELSVVDLNQLVRHEEKLCFFTNVVNLLYVHGIMDHVYTQLMQGEAAMTPSHTRHGSLGPHFDFNNFNVTDPPSCSDMVLERLSYLSKICYKIGQLGVISAFDLRYTFLRSELPPPSSFGQILQHRIHDIGEDDPWYAYLPPTETRLLFVISDGCHSAPILQSLRVDDLEEQLSVAMQQFLENNVLVDEEKSVVSIPECLDWFRKDFTGKSLPIDIQDGHIYGGLLNVVIPHVSQHLGEQLESLVLSCSPGKIELERSLDKTKGDGIDDGSSHKLKKSCSFQFTIRICRHKYDFGYKFIYQSVAQGHPAVHDLLRSNSNPELNGAESSITSRSRSSSLPLPPFKMTESTLRYLHSKSKLIASLVGLISAAVDDRTDRFASQKSVDSLSREDQVAQNIPGIEESIEEEIKEAEGTKKKESEVDKLQQHISGYATVQRYVEAFLTTILKVTETLQAEPDQSCPELASSDATGLTWRNTRACILSNLRSAEVQWLFHLTLNHLMSSCQWMECLDFIDALQLPDEDGIWLQDLSLLKDFILCCAAQGMPSQQDDHMAVDSWRYLLRLEDKTLAARVVLGSLSSLSVAACLELLHHCQVYPSSDERISKAIEDKLVKMKLYKKITEYALKNPPEPSIELVQESNEFPLQIAPNPYLDWQYVEGESQSNPHRILDVVIAAEDFDLAREWAQVHGVYEIVRQDIQEKYLLHLLKQEKNALKCFQNLSIAHNFGTNGLLQVLESIKDKLVCLSICESLLSSTTINLSSSVFLVQYVLDHFLNEVSQEKIEELQSISMGAKALLCLPERARSDYQQLMSKPNLIVEQLLMNMKVDWAAKVLKCLSHELTTTPFTPSSCSVAIFDQLVCKYAADAMFIPRLNLNISGGERELETSISSLHHSSTTPSLPSLLMSSSPRPSSSARQRFSVASMTPHFVSSTPVPSTSTPVNVPGEGPGFSKSATIRGGSPGGMSTISSISSRSTRPLRRQSSTGDIRISTSSSPLKRQQSFSTLPEINLPSTPPKKEDWVPDASVSHCMVCKEERFSMFNRRHHCRRCGRVVCWRCSQLKAVIEGYGDTPVRVCSECFNTFIMPRSTQGRAAQPSLEQRIRERFSSSRLSPNRSPGGLLQGSPLMGSIPGTPHSQLSGDASQQAYLEEFQLTLDEGYNAAVREDFYYEHAPSTSLCLSILELHSDPRECGQQILQRCQDLSEFLRPIKPGVPNPEVDYNLIINMMKTLLFNAKLKFLKDGDSSSVELCDSYLSHVDLLCVFVSSNCADIPSIQQLQKADSARQVRDRLMKEERLSLAQEVSTKSGLDPVAVWTAWGMSCLKAGDYPGAREKFGRILKAPSDRNQMQPPIKLVADILQYLESAGASSLSLTDILTAPPGSIRDFIAEPKIQTQSSASRSAIFDSPPLQECLYYIKTYCSYSTMVHFYRKHKNFNLAVSFILQKRCSTEVFIETLLVPCMKQGTLGKLQNEMLRLDPTLNAWNAYLTATCKYLNRNSLNHVLYHFQLFMKDFVRAAMMCIKFFQSGIKTYSDLFDHLHHLEKARHHFKAVLDDKQWDSVPRPPITGGVSSGWAGAGTESNIRLMLTPSDLTKHMNTMKLQIEVTKFLHRMASKGSGLEGQATAGASASSSGTDAPRKPPTLFGNSKEKAGVARKVLLSGNTIQEGFQLAFRIIQDFRLPDTLIYSHVGRHLANIRKFKEIRSLLSLIRDTGLANDQSCDEILDACVRVVADDSSQAKEAEVLIKLMKSDTNKINAYILCGKLKSAYLLAVKGERVEDVQRIMRAAKQAGQSQAQMKAICQTWLASQEEKRRREQQAQQLLLQSKQPKY